MLAGVQQGLQGLQGRQREGPAQGAVDVDLPQDGRRQECGSFWRECAGQGGVTSMFASAEVVADFLEETLARIQVSLSVDVMHIHTQLHTYTHM